MQQPADMPPFSPAGWRGPAGAPSPISSRPPAPAPAPAQQHQHQQQMDEQHGGAAVSGSGSGSVDGGEEGERGGSSSAAGGNRWPRQETLALLKIRSEMDAAFREAALKGPLWEQVSRRLAEMGHTRSAKKCREKFENVDKYYRRTKDGRTGRGDGKTYRFFTELEALHGASAAHHPQPAHVAVAPPAAPAASTIGAYSGVPSAPRVLAPELSPPPLLLTQQPVPTEAAACLTTTTAAVGDASFSDDSDGEDTDETADGGKRKRRGGSWGHGGKAMRFFEGLMRQVMERQEAMQSRLLEAIERRDQDRMIREEAWRRQEVARLAREQDALAQERAVAASPDARRLRGTCTSHATAAGSGAAERDYANENTTADAAAAATRNADGDRATATDAADTEQGDCRPRAGAAAGGHGWRVYWRRVAVSVAEGGGARADPAADGDGDAVPGHGAQGPAVGGHLGGDAAAGLQPELQAVQGEVGEHQQVLQEGQGEQPEAPRGLQDLPLLPPARRALPHQGARILLLLLRRPCARACTSAIPGSRGARRGHRAFAGAAVFPDAATCGAARRARGQERDHQRQRPWERERRGHASEGEQRLRCCGDVPLPRPCRRQRRQQQRHGDEQTGTEARRHREGDGTGAAGRGHEPQLRAQRQEGR
uniref:Myb-like domain-containing protein n=1 Tax=Aegilops tauschii subsp. strangulata TaxID=200361 RepID=A0A453JDW3_AEGTS